jgi:hypothetical protein
MTIRTSRELHEIIDGIRDNVNPGLLAGLIPSNDPLFAVANILAALTMLSAVQARALAMILEKLEKQTTNEAT